MWSSQPLSTFALAVPLNFEPTIQDYRFQVQCSVVLAYNCKAGSCWCLSILISLSLLSSKSIPQFHPSLTQTHSQTPSPSLNFCPPSPPPWFLPLLAHSPAHPVVAHPSFWALRNSFPLQFGSRKLPRCLLLPCPGAAGVARVKVHGALHMSQGAPAPASYQLHRCPCCSCC